MHNIYTTSGFIIDSRPYGEADKIISIFTRNLGLIKCSAQGIRLEKSKLRCHARDYSFGTFSLVRGREFWRLTSAQGKELRSTKYEVRSTENKIRKSNLELSAKIAVVLKRFLHGEEANVELYECIDRCAEAAEVYANEQYSTALEPLIVLKILANLGYIPNSNQLAQFIDSKEISAELLKQVSIQKTYINQHINRALRESHL